LRIFLLKVLQRSRRRENEMSAEPATMNWREYVGRFSVEVEVSNHEDVVQAKKGFLPPDQVRRSKISGVVDTGAARLVLPASVVTALGLPEAGQITVRFADGRREPKTVVGDAQLEIQGRSSVFTAVVEPGRADALIGAIVLEELDFVPDCTRQALLPRDPYGLIAEID
jgi:predicted aspartyl protease